MHESFDFDKIQFIYFACITYTLGIIANNLLPNPRMWRFIPMFSSKSFMILAPTFKSMSYFELFVNGVR